MLKWFADRLAQTGKEVRKDQRGFTLIELLVVVIIIGILAAIAIPTFLNQRESAWDSSAESDLRNAGAAQEAVYAEDDSYTTDEDDLTGQGFNESEGVDVTLTSGNETEYCMTSEHEDSDTTFALDSDEGSIEEGGSCGG